MLIIYKLVISHLWHIVWYGANVYRSSTKSHEYCAGSSNCQSNGASRIKNVTPDSEGNLFTTSCAYYCSYIYIHVLGLDQKYHYGSCQNWVAQVKAHQDEEDYPYEIFEGWDFSVAKPGDIIIRSDDEQGHAMLYMGIGNISSSNQNNVDNSKPAIAHASGHGINIIESNLTEPYNREFEPKSSGCYLVRIKDKYARQLEETTNYTMDAIKQNLPAYFQNPTGDFKEVTHLCYDSPEDEKEIINYGQYSVEESKGLDISLSGLIDKILGFMFLPIKIVIIGWGNIFQNLLLTDLVNMITGVSSASIITVENIVFNKVPFLDINFFDYKTAGGEVLKEGSVIYILRETISTWYNIFRTVGMALMLLVLAYIAVRMAIASIGEEKAKYKKMFFDWLIGFVILFSIHYIMIAIVYVSQSLITFIKGSFMGEESLYDKILIMAYDLRISVGLPATLMYIMLILASVTYFFTYLKRFFTLFILTIFAPIIAISYALDRIKDGKSQAFNNWFKEYLLNVIMQIMHAVIYVVFVSTAFNLAVKGMDEMQNNLVSGSVTQAIGGLLGSSFMITAGAWQCFGTIIIALVFMYFSIRLEAIFKKIFGFDKAGFMEDIQKLATYEAATGQLGKMAGTVADKTRKYGKGFVKVPEFVANTVTLGGYKKLKSRVKNSDFGQKASEINKQINNGYKSKIKKEELEEEHSEHYEQLLSLLPAFVAALKNNSKNSENSDGSIAASSSSEKAFDSEMFLYSMAALNDRTSGETNEKIIKRMKLRMASPKTSTSSMKLGPLSDFKLTNVDRNIINKKKKDFVAGELKGKDIDSLSSEERRKVFSNVSKHLDEHKDDIVNELTNEEMNKVRSRIGMIPSNVQGDVISEYQNYVRDQLNKHYDDLKEGK